MRLVFLDFWGTVSSFRFRGGLDRDMCALVRQLCLDTEARIVITSDECRPYPECPDPFPRALRLLTEAGLEESLVAGCTKQHSNDINYSVRPAQIRAWLQQHNDVISYVIFDDRPLAFTQAEIDKIEHPHALVHDLESASRFIHTPLGIEPEHTARGYEILMRPIGSPS